MQLLDACTLFATLLMCGNELAVSAFVNPALWKRNNQELASDFAFSLGFFMPFWYGLCLLLLGGEAYLRRQESGHDFIIGAAILWAAVIVLTLSMLVPLNNRLASINKGVIIPNWKQISKRWDTLHRLRIVLLLIAAALFYRGLQH